MARDCESWASVGAKACSTFRQYVPTVSFREGREQARVPNDSALTFRIDFAFCMCTPGRFLPSRAATRVRTTWPRFDVGPGEPAGEKVSNVDLEQL
jgi:hypothetical protein